MRRVALLIAQLASVSGGVHLTKATFDSAVAGEKAVFVQFCTTWSARRIQMRRASRVCLLVRGAHQLGELHGSPFISRMANVRLFLVLRRSGHCKVMRPAWEELEAEMSSTFVIASVDCEVEAALCEEHSVRGHPTLR
jgi:hypothetical protein